MLRYMTFDMEIAVRYGTNVSILLGNIHYWIQKNKENDKHYHDGRYWTYNSVSAFHALLPCMSERAINTALSKAEAEGLIVTGNYNRLPFDRTKWYALTEKGEELFEVQAQDACSASHPIDVDSVTQKQQMDGSETSNVIPQNEGTNTKVKQIKTQKKEEHIVRKQASSQKPAPSMPWNEEGERVAEVVQALNEETGAHYRPRSAATMRPILARLREGFTVEDCKEVIRKKSAEWSGTDMAKFLRPQTLFGTKFEAYLNAPENPRDRTEAAIRRNASRYAGVIDEDEEF